MRKIALTMLLALWTLTCRAGEPHFKFCEQDAQTETPSRFLSVAADRELFLNCLVGLITPSTFDDPSRGTLFFASLYSNSFGTASPKPFGDGNAGLRYLYANASRYDITQSPGEPISPTIIQEAQATDPPAYPLVMGGAAYPCTTVGLRSSLSDATTQAVSRVDARACENLSLTAPITIGSAKKSVSLLIPSSGTWLLSGISNGATCFVTVLSGSSIIGQGSHNGGNKFSLMNNSSSVNADSMICTDPVVTGYVRIEGGLLLENLNGGTYVNGLLHAQNLYDASSFKDITVFNPGGIGMYVQGVCCGATFEELQIDGGNAAGSRPLVIDRGPVGGPRAISFINLSADHAGNGQSEITLMGGPYTNGVNFYNTYVEANAAGSGTPHIEILSAQGGVNFFGVQVGIENLSDTAPCIDIAADAGNAVNIYGLDCTQPGRIAIADHVLGQTIYSQIGGATPPYSNFINSTTFADLGTPPNGVPPIYCSDCTIANPCAGGGTGAFAKRLNGIWVCN